MTEEQIIIDPLSTQGLSRASYQVRAKDHVFVLSVYKPLTIQLETPRAKLDDAREFQRHLRSKGLPVVDLVGDVFQLPPLNYECELTNFIHGYQIKTGDTLSEKELSSLAHSIASMHCAGQNYMPNGKPKNYQITATNLPQGFIHGDLHPGNFIFSGDTHEVKGIIDFELAHYTRLRMISVPSRSSRPS